MPLTLGDLWKALGTGPWPAEETAALPLADVVVHSRLAVEGSLFVALRGEQTDGHLHVGDAFPTQDHVPLTRYCINYRNARFIPVAKADGPPLIARTQGRGPHCRGDLPLLF